MKPLISIIVPVYNAEQQLGRCVNSLIKQSYSEIEIILVNDGSTDKSQEICQEFMQDKRVKYVEQENSGVSSARNLGLSVARGEWIVFVDSDDLIDYKYCQYIVENLEEKVDVLFFAFRKISKQGKMTVLYGGNEDVNKKQFRNFQKWILNQYYYKEDYAISAVWGKAYKKDFLNQYNIRFNEDLAMGEDKLFNFQVYQFASKGKYLNYSVYDYYCDSTSASSQYRPNIIEEYEKLLCGMDNLIKRYKLEDEMEAQYNIRVAMALMYYVVLNYCHKNNNKVFSMRKKEFLKLVGKPQYKMIIDVVGVKSFPVRQRILWLTIKLKRFELIQFLCFINKILNGR